MRPIVFILCLSLTSCQFLQLAGLEKKRLYNVKRIFSPGEYGAQCHSSTIMELSNGDLLAAWWSGSREGAPDAVIKAARLPWRARAWESAVTLADISGRFVGNPVLFSHPDGRAWLFFVRVPPVSPGRVQILWRESVDLGYSWGPVRKFLTEPGIRTRNHPIVMQSNEILLPLHDQLTGQSVFLVLKHDGTWERGGPVVSEPSNTQPTVISRRDGSLYALMRTWHEDPAKRFLWQTESMDYGRTWASPRYSEIPAVDSAIEMITLKNGHVVLAFNDGRNRKRSPLNLALSLDEGRTWPFSRMIETGDGPFSYPSMIQTRDGHIHVTYTFRREYIKHIEVNEAWIRGG